jgi:hypothetical protein
LNWRTKALCAVLLVGFAQELTHHDLLAVVDSFDYSVWNDRILRLLVLPVVE